MDRWEGKTAVVTGASAGIGAVIAEHLVKAGVLVVGLARRLEKLEQVSASLKEAKGKFYPRQCDIGKEEDLLAAFKWVNAELGGVDILVNNAAVVTFGKLINDGTDAFRNILNVNVLAMAIAIREAVASMKTRDVAGYIININSVAGHALPSSNMTLGLYPSSKFAVTALTETVRKELASEANNKIRITSLSPESTRTTDVVPDEKFFADNETLKNLPLLEPEDIANGVLFVLSTGDKVQVTELTIRPLNENF